MKKEETKPVITEEVPLDGGPVTRPTKPPLK